MIFLFALYNIIIRYKFITKNFIFVIMENIKKCTKKLNEYYIPNMLETMISMQNNIKIKENLNKSIMNFTDEKSLIHYIKIISEDKTLISNNLNNILSNFFKLINTYENNLQKIKNEILSVQKILLENKEEEIKDLFTSQQNIKKEKMPIYLSLIEINQKYSKLLKINWEIVDFKDYFSNSDKLLKSLINIYQQLKEF